MPAVQTRPITLTVNGQRRRIDVDPQRSLLDVLREELDLTGAKKACDAGECGSCAVLLGDRSVMSCLLPVSRVGSKPVTTIEGLAAGDDGRPRCDSLHPLQQAFVDLGATQCGFCIPGIIMEACALLERNPHATRRDVVTSLSRNLCRCTGYVKIIDAVLHAGRTMRGGEAPAASGEASAGGTRVPKFDSEDQVTGRAKYAADLKKDGALVAKILRSPHHHARILGIDTSEAESLPGVEAVITARDIPGEPAMFNARPQPSLFARDKARFVGEAIAAVAATSEEAAAEAVGRIKVSYEVLRPVLDPLEAMRDDSEPIDPPCPNWVVAAKVTRGDVDEAFVRSDVIVAGTYRTAPREHAPMEPEAGLAYLDEDGRLIVHAPHHHPFAAQMWLAEMLGIERDRVRVICPAMGGNFGHRGDFLHDGVIGLLVFKTGKPVKIVYTREESLLGSCKAQSYALRYRTGATRDGKLTALRAEVIGDGGCWIPHPELTSRASGISHLTLFAPGPYVVPNADITIYEVCTNRPRSNPMRGTHIPDLAFAWDSQVEMLAARLAMDPLEFRLRNVVESGSPTVTGQILDESVGARATLEALREPYDEALARAASEPPVAPWRRGLGLACIWQVNGGGRGEEAGGGWHGRKLGPARVAVELLDDGRVRVLGGFVEKGQGISVAVAQVASHELALPLDRFVMVYGDTLLAPYPVGTSGQRTLFHVGGAVQRACQALRAALVQVAADGLQEPADRVRFEDGFARSPSGHCRPLSMADLAAALRCRGLPLRYEGTFVFGPSERGEGPVFGYCSQLVELDVNLATGDVKVRGVTYAADVGRVVNRLTFEGQVEGGVMMGLSYALRERFVPGQTRTLEAYGLPTTADVPDRIVTLVVEEPVLGAPLGAKGAAEMTASAGLAAVANAVARATGARVYEVPISPGAILDAIGAARTHAVDDAGRAAHR
jgi:aldehyde oxidoreductase